MKGNCHCGRYRFSVKLAAGEQWMRDGVNACNCSICTKKGYLWVFPANSGSAMRIEQGDEGSLKGYTFGNRSREHLFCPTCGTPVQLNEGGKLFAVNARSFKGPLDLDALTVHPFDGGSLDPPYQPPTQYPMLKAELAEGEKLYHGSCHCGAVTYTVKHKPIEEVMSCNCSWCGRNGELWIYPMPNDVALEGQESMTEYQFGRKEVTHVFCGTCGVSVTVVGKAIPVQPVNVRTMNGVDLDKLKIKKGDGWSLRDPPYEI